MPILKDILEKVSPIKQTNASLREWASALLAHADVKIDGDRPWDIRVHNEELWGRVVREGSLGLGEAYMDGWWDCEALDQFFARILEAGLDSEVQILDMPFLAMASAMIQNPQSAGLSWRVGKVHYDLGNEFYQSWLDPHMQYSCGYWANGAESLEAAQEAKLDLICRKLDLKAGERVLEIGCGWGGWARYAARKYGVTVDAYTISSEQAKWAQQHNDGLPITYHLKDYRDISGTFDKVVSIGMFEHVGPRNNETFFKVVEKALKPGGIFLLHTIGTVKATWKTDKWLDTYIFPGSVLPSPAQLAKALDGKFVLEDWHNFGAYYDPTLMAWHANFEASWPRFREQCGERFYRMWRYYLLSCAALFRVRNCQLYQLVLSKGGLPGGWTPVR